MSICIYRLRIDLFLLSRYLVVVCVLQNKRYRRCHPFLTFVHVFTSLVSSLHSTSCDIVYILRSTSFCTKSGYWVLRVNVLL